MNHGDATPPAPDQPGIRCPRCGCCDLRTTHTIRQPGSVKRYRRCRHCGRRVTTYERTPGGNHREGRGRE